MLFPQENHVIQQRVRLHLVFLYQTADFFVSVRHFRDNVRRDGLLFQLCDFLPLFLNQFPRRVLALLRRLLLARRRRRRAKVDVAEKLDLHFQLDFRHAAIGLVIVFQFFQAGAKVQHVRIRQLSMRGQEVRVDFRLAVRLIMFPRRFKLPKRILPHVPPDNHEKELAISDCFVNLALRPVRAHFMRHILRVVPFQTDATRLVELVQRP